MRRADHLWIIFPLLAVPARIYELKNNLDGAGLPIGGFPYLPAVLALAALAFLISARKLPERDSVTGGLTELFRFDGQLTLAAAVSGAFLLIVSAALRLVTGGFATLDAILAIFLAVSGAALLYVLVSLRRGKRFEPVALLVPVCCLVVQLIAVYRANARDSVPLHFYAELLAVAALCLSALYFAAFAYRCGSPRAFTVAARMAAVLTAASCADMALAHRLPGLAACVGALLLLLALLEAAGNFEG